MPTRPPDITLESLRGGLNDSDPPNALAIDECTIAKNVEWYYSTLGERRRGTVALDLTGAEFANEDMTVFLTRHFPTAIELDNELWAVGATEGVSVTISRRDDTGWTTIVPVDAVSPDAPDIFEMSAQSLDGKLFVAYASADGTDRLHVFDGTTLRRTGLSEPDPPAVADEGAGTYATERFFRVRYTEMDGDTILRRSEPSESTPFTPLGTGAGATITRPDLLGEGETHWEVEGSTDDTLFYVLATLPIATTTYDDEVAFEDGYEDSGDLSENIGTYEVLPSAKFLAADDDRLIMGGSFVDPTLASRVSWTPVRKDPGVGNFERLPLEVDNFLNLDSYEGGGLTGISQAISGSWYAFKWGHIYKMVRTGNRTDAYKAITLSKVRGAIQGSIVSGMDEFGRPCIYFLDPRIGPSRLSGNGLQQCNGLRKTWTRFNGSAEQVAARGVYYPDKQQVKWWIAVDGEESPSLGLTLQVNELREMTGGVKRGWSTFTGLAATALAATVLTEQLEDENGNIIISTRPIIGMTSPNAAHRMDIGDTDNGTAYYAKMRSRPLFQAGLLNRWGAMTAALLAVANGSAQLAVRFIRNFGLETNEIITDLAPVADEDYVIKAFDDLVMSSSIGIQVEFSDVGEEI